MVARIERMRRVHWSNRAPVAVLINEPSSWPQTLHHVPDRRLLPAGKPEQHQTRADQMERARTERLQRVVEDVVLAHLEVRKIESLQVSDIDVCGHDLTGADLKARPARPDQLTPSARERVEDAF